MYMYYIYHIQEIGGITDEEFLEFEEGCATSGTKSGNGEFHVAAIRYDGPEFSIRWLGYPFEKDNTTAFQEEIFLPEKYINIIKKTGTGGQCVLEVPIK